MSMSINDRMYLKNLRFKMYKLSRPFSVLLDWIYSMKLGTI